MRKRKVLLSTETPQWAWGHMFRGIAKYAPSEFDVEVCDNKQLHEILKNRKVALEYDACCQSSWMEAITCRQKKKIDWFRMSTLIASHGCQFPYPAEDAKSIPAKIATALRNTSQAKKRLLYFDSLLCVSDRLHRHLEPSYGTARRVIPGVDHTFFCPQDRRSSSARLVIGWCGQSSGVTKGYREVLKPLMAKVGSTVKWKILTRTHRDAYTHDEMKEWYRGIDVLLSTSCSEGFQMPTLEAAACGKPVIMTRCGGAEELATGWLKVFLVDGYHYAKECNRVVQDISALLIAMNRKDAQDAGLEFRKRIDDTFSWERQAGSWLEAMCS